MSPDKKNDEFDLALQHHQAGRLQEAERLFRQFLTQNPDNAVAIHHLGVIAHQMGRNDAAADLIRRAIALSPNYAEAHSNLGNVLNAKKQFDEAIVSFRKAIELNANFAGAHANLGIALKGKGQLDEAIAEYRKGITLSPNYALAHYNLGIALKDKGQFEEAIAAFRQAIALRPEFAEAHSNLGSALHDRGHLDEAIIVFRQALALKPGLPEVHKNLALALLARGDFEQGWDEYEWRWKCKDFPSPPPNFNQPQWDGRPLEGRTVLLHTEQGFGDAMQFIRYLPMVAQRGGKIVVGCRVELQRLFQTMASLSQVVSPAQPLPAFDFHCSLLSLPRIFKANLDNLPQVVPYLHADAEGSKTWQRRIGEDSAILNVGLAWAGSPTHKNDRNRSMALASLSLLGQVPGVRFFSLQKGEAAAKDKVPSASMELVDWTDELKDFADTAALIANLDLVIAVDTAVAHLAGAMGKPVWTLLPFVSEWRWLLHREDSPWYPSMRLFRQDSRRHWDSVIAQVSDALSHWLKNHR